jgi:hypothetical protein
MENAKKLNKIVRENNKSFKIELYKSDVGFKGHMDRYKITLIANEAIGYLDVAKDKDLFEWSDFDKNLFSEEELYGYNWEGQAFTDVYGENFMGWVNHFNK